MEEKIIEEKIKEALKSVPELRDVKFSLGNFGQVYLSAMIDVNPIEELTTYEDAKSYLCAMNPFSDSYHNIRINENAGKSMLPLIKLKTIANAWNMATNDKYVDKKYCPVLKKVDSKFIYSHTTIIDDCSSNGAPIYLNTEELAKEFCNKFIDLWNEYLSEL